MPDEPGVPDCRTCAACCRGAFAQVSISPQAPIISRHPELVRLRDGSFELARRDDRCAALEREGELWSCTVHPDRPRTCREFEAGSERCLAARARLGLGG